MLTKAQIKLVRSLAQQKFRNEHNMYLVEGVKLAEEWLFSNEHIEFIIGAQPWVEANLPLIARHPEAQLQIVKDFELEAISALTTPNQVAMVVKIPANTQPPVIDDWCIALDNIRDPGNMGAIIRIADWFGIKYVACSPGCVEKFNPKVVQAAMGGHLRVNIFETDLFQLFETTKLPVMAATLQGRNIYDVMRPEAAIIVIGNESQGVGDDLLKLVSHEITIPKRGGAESLNAAVSAGIICALMVQGR